MNEGIFVFRKSKTLFARFLCLIVTAGTSMLILTPFNIKDNNLATSPLNKLLRKTSSSIS